MNLTLNAWWQTRDESAESCARRLSDMLARLALLHPVFAQWRQQGDSEEESQEPLCSMPPDHRELQNFVEANIMRDDADEPWPELGYSLSAWNEVDDSHGLSFHIRAGVRDGVDANSLFFQLGNVAPANSDLLNYDVLKDVLNAVCQAWDVDWGTIEPFDWERRLKDSSGHFCRPWGGWLTYLSPAYRGGIKMPIPEAITEPLSNGGMLIALTKEGFNESDPTQLATYDAVQKALRPLQG